MKKRHMSNKEFRKKSEANPRGTEFDDLVTALRSGEVFEKDVNKIQKRNRQRRSGVEMNDRERTANVYSQI